MVSSPWPWRDAHLYNKRYLFWEVSRLLQSYGLTLRSMVGLGYGPLKFGRREFVPENWSILLSKQLTRLSHKLLFFGGFSTARTAGFLLRKGSDREELFRN